MQDSVFPIRHGRKTNKVIILDIDNTLLSTMLEEQHAVMDKLDESRYRIIDIAMKLDVDGRFTYMQSVLRPHLEQFLEWCNVYFSQVIIWTAGTRPYAEAVVEALYDGKISPPPIVFARENCYKEGDNYYKTIERLIHDHPFLQKFMNMSNCVIVDDTPSTYKYNFDNAIGIPPYLRENFSEDTLNQSDDCLRHIIAFFENQNVKNAQDMRLVPKNMIFNMSINELRNSPPRRHF